ncbi:MAG TPA: hypothetical protein VI542_28110 [Candidatus Tectomicrobia bacterium]
MGKSSPNDHHKIPQKLTFRPLTMAQENAIDALLLGHTDGEVATLVGVDRGTVWTWRHAHPLFAATLEQRRADLWRAPQEKLRALAMRAAENLAAAVEEGNLKASIEVLKAIGLYGAVAPADETDPDAVLRQYVQARLDREIPGDVMSEFLIDQTRPGWSRRKQALEAELAARYLEGEA